MFIQVIEGHVADAEEMRGALARWQRDLAPGSIGWLGTTAGITEDGMFVALARFESEDAARRNSERPEQHQWWMDTAKLFAGDVRFHDCREVITYLRGGSDDAGFVQVMQGRVLDADRMRSLLRQAEDEMSRLRPEIIGGMIGLHDGDRFTQAIYFTSEAAARAGERVEVPAQLRDLMPETGSLLADLAYHDLREPWLYSPS